MDRWILWILEKWVEYLWRFCDNLGKCSLPNFLSATFQCRCLALVLTASVRLKLLQSQKKTFLLKYFVNFFLLNCRICSVCSAKTIIVLYQYVLSLFWKRVQSIASVQNLENFKDGTNLTPLAIPIWTTHTHTHVHKFISLFHE